MPCLSPSFHISCVMHAPSNLSHLSHLPRIHPHLMPCVSLLLRTQSAQLHPPLSPSSHAACTTITHLACFLMPCLHHPTLCPRISDAHLPKHILQIYHFILDCPRHIF